MNSEYQYDSELSFTLKDMKSARLHDCTGHEGPYGWGWCKKHPKGSRQVHRGQISVVARRRFRLPER